MNYVNIALKGLPAKKIIIMCFKEYQIYSSVMKKCKPKELEKETLSIRID